MVMIKNPATKPMIMKAKAGMVLSASHQRFRRRVLSCVVFRRMVHLLSSRPQCWYYISWYYLSILVYILFFSKWQNVKITKIPSPTLTQKTMVTHHHRKTYNQWPYYRSLGDGRCRKPYLISLISTSTVRRKHTNTS